MLTENKEILLRNEIKKHNHVIVAYSGGVDSTLVSKIATQELKNNARIILSASPSLPRHELNLAKDLAKHHDFNLEIIHTKEMNDQNYTSNPYNRCYFCKKELYSFLKTIVSKGIVVLDGTNYDDLKDIRHGKTAANELNILSPLSQLKFSKKDVRELSQKIGLENWDKPQAACLSSRFPTGISITEERLKKVEDAEFFLQQIGINIVRVRYHYHIARIESNLEGIHILLKNNEKIESYFKTLGFDYTTIDIMGYHRNSMNK